MTKLHPQIEYIKSLGSNIDIIASPFVSDLERVKRTWKERLFSRPWNPLQKYKTEYRPYALIAGSICIVSYQTYAKLIEEGMKYETN